MYAVIFKAKTNNMNNTYYETAARMRKLAIKKYACSEFVSVTENDQEISISYWNNLSDITEWKHDADHLAAQESGKSAWFSEYQVQVVEIIREYDWGCKKRS